MNTLVKVSLYSWYYFRFVNVIWIPVADCSVTSMEGTGFGAFGGSSKRKRRSKEEVTTFISAMA
jgi:hypothetical protein